MEPGVYIGFARLPKEACYTLEAGLFPEEENILVSPCIEQVVNKVNLIELHLQCPEDIMKKDALGGFVGYLREGGVKVIMHSPFMRVKEDGSGKELEFFGFGNNENAEYDRNMLLQTVDFAAEHRIGYLTVHAGQILQPVKDFESWKSGFLPVFSYGKEKGVIVGVETGTLSLEQHIELIKEHGIPTTLDHAHVELIGEDSIYFKRALMEHSNTAVITEHVSEVQDGKDAHRELLKDGSLDRRYERVFNSVRQNRHIVPQPNIVCEFRATAKFKKDPNIEEIVRIISKREERPYMLLVSGLPSSGKSTVARYMEGQVQIESDQIRMADERFSKQLKDWAENIIVSKEERAGVYIEMIKKARKDLREGRSVVLDGTFCNNEERQLAYSLAGEFENHPGFRLYIIDVCCSSRPEVIARLVHRTKYPPVSLPAYYHLETELRMAGPIEESNYFGRVASTVFPVIKYDTFTGAIGLVNEGLEDQTVRSISEFIRNSRSRR